MGATDGSDAVGTLEDERLVLRRFRTDDWPDLQAYVSRPDVTRYDHAYPTDDEGCQKLAAFFATQDWVWAVCLRDGGTLVGHVVSKRIDPPEFQTWDLGFVFDPRFQGRGYATEAARRLLRHVFEDLGARRVETHCYADNSASWRLLERLWLRREGHHVKSGFIERDATGAPIWSDSLDYAILRAEWEDDDRRDRTR